ncbi:MAG TPA: SpoIID/LytB domain-containing protein [Solirubrobacteraceae bacterium]|nr:SpoIID/LytB domain-containing protein [Solirubrobacteraceae bacterium]
MPATFTRTARRTAATTAAAALAALSGAAGAAPAQAAVTIDGRGFGHGVGMSQFGAYGFALRENRTYRSILRHYYTGTQIDEVDARRIRVLLKRSSSMTVCRVTRARDARGVVTGLTAGTSYRFSPAGGASLRVHNTDTGSRVRTMRAPVRLTGGSRTCLRGSAENGVADGQYRGAMALHRVGSTVQAVNDVHSRHYLYGVVPAEVPTSWPLEAVKAQAVAARSYALRSLRPGATFDVFADTRSQVYKGFAGEDARGRQAVRETREEVVTYGGQIAQTFFFSTSGGRTTSNESGFGGGEPLPYLRPVDDPHDDISPVHTWRSTFGDGQVAQKLGVGGALRSIRVVERGSDDRVRRVEVRGSGGTRTLTGAEVRSRLGLRSTWFSIG